MAIFPLTQAAPNNERIKNKIIAEAPKLENLFPELLTPASDSDTKSEYIRIGDPGILTKTTLSREEILKLACFPGYSTPNQVSSQDISNENNEQMLLDDANYPIPTIIIVDEEMVSYYVSSDPWFATWLGLCIWVDNILEHGDDYLESPYDIDFQTNWNYIMYWDTPDYMTYYGLLDQLSNPVYGVDPTGVGCDVMVLMSGQYGGPGGGGGEIIGLANQNGRHFIINACITEFGYPSANIFQHEASHLFDCSDHLWDYTYCIMNYRYQNSYRGYCTGCDTQLYLNAGRFN